MTVSHRLDNYLVLYINLFLSEGFFEMATGTVKWFNKKKGYGFITPDDGGYDVFVHITAVKEAGLFTLRENAKVSFELKTEREKTVAGSLKLVEEASAEA